MHTKCGFPLVPVPTYLPTSKKLGQSSVCYIEDAANWEVSSVEQEMLTIMEEQQEDSPMTCLMLVFIVLFLGHVHLGSMTWDMALTGSVPSLLMEMHFRDQITGLKAEHWCPHQERKIGSLVHRMISRIHPWTGHTHRNKHQNKMIRLDLSLIMWTHQWGMQVGSYHLDSQTHQTIIHQVQNMTPIRQSSRVILTRGW